MPINIEKYIYQFIYFEKTYVGQVQHCESFRMQVIKLMLFSTNSVTLQLCVWLFKKKLKIRDNHYLLLCKKQNHLDKTQSFRHGNCRSKFLFLACTASGYTLSIVHWCILFCNICTFLVTQTWVGVLRYHNGQNQVALEQQLIFSYGSFYFELVFRILCKQIEQMEQLHHQNFQKCPRSELQYLCVGAKFIVMQRRYLGYDFIVRVAAIWRGCIFGWHECHYII